MKMAKLTGQLFCAASFLYFLIRLIGAKSTGINPEFIQKGLIPAVIMACAGSLLLVLYYRRIQDKPGTRYSVFLLFLAVILGGLALFTRSL